MHHFLIHPHQNILVKDIVRSTLHYTSQRWTWFCFPQTKLCYGFPLMLLRWGFWRGILTEFWHACDMSVLADVTGAVHAIRVTLCDTASRNMSHASICSLNRISNYYIQLYGLYMYIDYILHQGAVIRSRATSRGWSDHPRSLRCSFGGQDCKARGVTRIAPVCVQVSVWIRR